MNILKGDCREVLRTLASESVHCVVTSPPYWGLRDYGTAKWEGGDAGCDHKGPPLISDKSNIAGYSSEKIKLRTFSVPFRDSCGKCGALRIDSQLGLEPTYQEYVASMVAVFREVRRVLRKDGTCWVNLGDSYAANVNGRSAADVKALGNDDRTFRDKPFSTIQGVLKPKDMCGIPWRVAFALQADGWWLRQDIIWSKPNPMPESVTDRCTKAHEYLFLLSKSERYYYDAEAIREVAVEGYDLSLLRTKASVPSETIAWHAKSIIDRQAIGVDSRTAGNGFRNKRSVWEIATQPFPEAHFATFPPALIEPCIKAGCPQGGTVLDPFGGAGTTGLVADRLGRNSILIELNPEYAAMAERRIRDDAGMFAEVVAQ